MKALLGSVLLLVLVGLAYFAWGSLAPEISAPLQGADLAPVEEKVATETALEAPRQGRSDRRGEISGEEAERAAPRPESSEAVAAAATTSASAPSATVEVRFVDNAGLPVPQVEFSVAATHSASKTVATTGGTGSARALVKLAEAGAQDYVASWRSAQHVSGEESIVLKAGQARHLGTILLASGAHVEGRVLDDDGQPILGANVWWEPEDLPDRAPVLLRRFGSERKVNRGGPTWGAPATAAESDAQGYYRLGGTPTQGVRIWAGTKGRRMDWSDPLTLDEGEVRRGVDLVLSLLQPEDHIAGRVVDADGNSLAEAQLRFQFNSEDMSMSSGVPLEEDGSFDCLVHRDVPYRFYATMPDDSLTPASADSVMPGTLDLVLQLGLGTDESVQVHVLNEEGEPVERFGMVFTYVSDSGSFGTGEGEKDHPDGRAQIVLGPGDFLLGVRATGYATGEAGPFINGVVPGGLIEVVLTRMPAVTGVVTANGEAVSGARVALARLVSGDTWMRVNGYTSEVRGDSDFALTDAEGRFKLMPRELGEFRLRAEPPRVESGEEASWAAVESTTFQVTTGALEADYELELARPGTLLVQVRRADGGDAAGTLVSLNRYDAHPRVVVADSDGRVRVAALMPGGWEVGVAAAELRVNSSSSSSGTGATSEWPTNCILRPGETTSFELLVPLED